MSDDPKPDDVAPSEAKLELDLPAPIQPLPPAPEAPLELETAAPAAGGAARAALLKRADSYGKLAEGLLTLSAVSILGLIGAVGFNAVWALSRDPSGTSPSALADPSRPRDRSNDGVVIFGAGDAPKSGEKVEIVEQVNEADEYLLTVDSTPDAAKVVLNGVVRGETPASMNLSCAPGEALELVLTRPGYLTVRHTLSCKAHSIVTVRARLDSVKARK